MSNRSTTDAIQKDWKEREMIEIVHLNILKASTTENRVVSATAPRRAQLAFGTSSRSVDRNRTYRADCMLLLLLWLILLLGGMNNREPHHPNLVVVPRNDS